MTIGDRGRQLFVRVRTTALGAVRRSGREVAWTAPWMRLGNYLMLGCWAHERSGRVVIRRPDNPLLDLFPRFVSDYLIGPDEVRFTDNRIMPWSGRTDDLLDWGLLSDFISEKLAPNSPLAGMAAAPTDALVINVRRGDYYSVPANRQTFGMNIEAYVRAAVDRAVRDEGLPRSIHVVSDDVQWCRDHLHPTLASIASVDYRPSGDPAGDLAVLTNARRLVIPNSTFSIWGGFIGDALYPDRRVYAPRMFARGLNNGRGLAYHPRWSIIEDLPGGWDYNISR